MTSPQRNAPRRRQGLELRDLSGYGPAKSWEEKHAR